MKLEGVREEGAFDAPWQLRVYAAAAALERAGALDRERFRSEFRSELASAGVGPGTGDRATYFQCWMAALERCLAVEGRLSAQEIDEAVARLAAHAGAAEH